MFTEIQQSLSDAVVTGKIGTPVSVRVHLQLPEPDADFDAALDSVIAMVEPAIPPSLKTLQSRVNCDGHQWNLLMRTPNGRTLFVTLGRGSATRPALELLVVGNHGVIRLEGGDIVFDAVSGELARFDTRTPADRWSRIVQKSHDDGVAVSLHQ